MKRHEMDSKVNDFIWKQNRLSKDKEALKNSMLDVIRKKPKNLALQQNTNLNGTATKQSVVPRESGVGNQLSNQALGYQGTGGQGGGTGTMMAMQQAPAAYQYQNAQQNT